MWTNLAISQTGGLNVTNLSKNMFMGQDFTRNPFLTSKCWKELNIH